MEQKTVSKMELTTTSEGVPLGLVTAIQLWADARTDASSARRRDLIRDKISTLGAFFGDAPPNFRLWPSLVVKTYPFGKSTVK